MLLSPLVLHRLHLRSAEERILIVLTSAAAALLCGDQATIYIAFLVKVSILALRRARTTQGRVKHVMLFRFTLFILVEN